ncbi:cobalamin biosynthesis protein CobQ [Sulfurovum lithotrophicum]|uniref:Cobyric acid synthase n=1 Tax=Sulfurovum lithotrophicum TaxID=206403 RepID=A0A7U4RQT7_9BACT|nr:cobyric acid synthase [Sulfurovum lithotrophicum]AKF25228.1 cobalamin biosynthesis protein CobQ [Sulfurovum lithotrophicum]
MHNFSIFGSSSDAGKSTLTWVIGRILQEAGYSIAPFKAQNVSNNAHVADDGSEIAVAQYFQAKALGVSTSWHNNPILLKSGQGSSASLIVSGKSIADKDVRAYYRELDSLKPVVKEAFEWLDARYDIVIAEGAGSPVELNLMDKDLSNIFIATEFNTRIILVADIEKGGVFASIYGVYNLLPKQLKENVIGVIINKFRGDISLFDEGIHIIEKEFGIPVLGVLPYLPFNLGFEDSQSLTGYTQDCTRSTRHVAVIAYPTMSNYTDFEPLLADPNTCVEFIKANVNLSGFECIILPGSKRVIDDLRWLKHNSLFSQLQRHYKEGKIHLIGICGGYQMMFEHIQDKEGVEANGSANEEALGFIDDTIVFRKEKVLERCNDTYEIHHGISKKYPDGYKKGKLYGTFSHGLFIDDWFKTYEQEQIKAFTQKMKAHLDTERIIQNVC